MSSEEPPRVYIRLWRQDAIVLFDWLQQVNLNAIPITHRAQKQALADLASALEWVTDLDVTELTEEEIRQAQDDVSRDMGW